MKYFSIKHIEDREIDIATAPLDQVLDAYNSLFEMSNDGGAFPTSKAALKAKVFWDKWRAIETARPEIIEYRKQQIAASRDHTPLKWI